jgi:hypothetical protein
MDKCSKTLFWNQSHLLSGLVDVLGFPGCFFERRGIDCYQVETCSVGGYASLHSVTSWYSVVLRRLCYWRNEYWEAMFVEPLWNCCGPAVELMCTCCGTAVDLLWNCCGPAVELLWTCCRTDVDMPWNCCGPTVELLWTCCGTAVELMWTCCGTAAVRADASCFIFVFFWLLLINYLVTYFTYFLT